jgi:hypothetical protein
MKVKARARESLFWWSVGGVLAVAILGTLLHFLYDWTGESPVFKPFSAIDESTWQHMKIMYFPMLIFGVVQWFFFRREYECYFVIKFVGILVGLTLIPVLFYTYNGAFGKSPDWLNITIFMVADLLAFAVEYMLFKRAEGGCRKVWNILALVGIIAIGVMFVVFTYLPPNLPLFISPV